MNPTLKKFLPHLIAYVIMLAIAFVRFAPIVFEGKALQQSDNIQAYGMQVELRKFHDKTGEYPLWTNSMFAGMPAYQIMYAHKGLLQWVGKAALLGNGMAPPHTGILLMMACFYLLLIVLGVDWRVGIVGAVGFGLAANHMGLVEAGHSTKVVAAAYSAPILAGLILTFRGKYWLGGALTALFVGLQLYANHVQVTYLFFLTLVIFGIVLLVDAIRKGTLPNFAKAAGVSLLAVGLGIACNYGRLATTQEYAAETIRGTSELTKKGNSSGSSADEGGGLSKEYAFTWSYAKLESFNLLIPNYLGGSSAENFLSDPGSATLAALRQMNNPDEANKLARYATHYWGDVPFTGGPVYMGAVFILLFFLGAFLVKSPLKWYIVASVIFTILLSWGRNFAAFNYFVFDYFPFFNKFRDATTALGATNLLVVLLATLGLQAFFDKTLDEKERNAALLKAGGITGGLILIAFALSFGFDYAKPGNDLPATVASALAKDRAALLQADVLRSLLFAALGFALLWVWTKKRFAAVWSVIGIGLVATADIWGVGSRFISSDDFVSVAEKRSIIAPTAADEQINKDPDPYYRVADFRGNPFTNALTSYHHLSMGGYHAAKLMRYQEMIERYLSDPAKYQKLYGMFNAKYIIGNGDQVFPNPDALGNAWFVREFEIVPDGDAEIAALATLEPAQKAVVQQKQADQLQGFNLQYDSTATIRLTHYHPDTMIYSYTTSSEQLAVFSEMYYPPSKGWEMYLDGQKAPDFFKANFTLRAAKLPAGQHEVKMIFAPKTYYRGEMISLVASILVLGLMGWGIFWFSKNYAWPDAAHLPEAEEKAAKVRPVIRTEARKKKK
ncbi:MAG: hypothetical protein R2830_08780 [Saprospiraceae bacterium]